MCNLLNWQVIEPEQYEQNDIEEVRELVAEFLLSEMWSRIFVLISICV